MILMTYKPEWIAISTHLFHQGIMSVLIYSMNANTITRRIAFTVRWNVCNASWIYVLWYLDKINIIIINIIQCQCRRSSSTTSNNSAMAMTAAQCSAKIWMRASVLLIRIRWKIIHVILPFHNQMPLIRKTKTAIVVIMIPMSVEAASAAISFDVL